MFSIVSNVSKFLRLIPDNNLENLTFIIKSFKVASIINIFVSLKMHKLTGTSENENYNFGKVSNLLIKYSQFEAGCFRIFWCRVFSRLNLPSRNGCYQFILSFLAKQNIFCRLFFCQVSGQAVRSETDFVPNQLDVKENSW